MPDERKMCNILLTGISFHFHFWDINDKKKIVFDIDMIFYDSFIPFLIKNRLNNLPFNKTLIILTYCFWAFIIVILRKV